MKLDFKYCLLKYVHSEILNEEITVGIIFLFKNKQKVYFKYPKSLKRLSGLYKDFSDWQLNAYLKAFEKKCLELNVQLNVYLSNGDIIGLVNSELITKETSSLKFSNVFSNVLSSHDDIETIVNRYSTLYLSEYESPLKDIRHDELYVTKQIKNLLKSKKNDIDRHLRQSFPIFSKDKSTKIDFEFAWQNLSLHLVKPISFDLAEKTIINHKAILNQALLNYTADIAKEKGYVFDILISSPQKEDKHLLEAFKVAVDILEKSKAPKNIILENRFQEYSDTTISEIIKHIN